MKLSDLLQQIYIEMGLLRISTAESGSNNTIVDSGLGEVSYENDWMNGTAIVLSADELAPEGEFSRIIGFDRNFGTLTLESSLSEAVEAGDSYGLAGTLLPVTTLIELVNYAVRSLGDVPLIDELSTENEAEVVWNKRPPILIDLNVRAGYQNWQRVLDWEYVPGAQCLDGKINFRGGFPAGSELRIWYVDKHPVIQKFDDQVSDMIAPELASAVCMERVCRWLINKLGGGDKYQQRMWEDAKKELESARTNHPIWKPRRGARMMLANLGCR
jgi:hypothetical protein